MDNDTAFAPIPEFPGYHASRTGEIASHVRGPRRILKPYRDSDGYACLRLNQNGKRVHVFVHTLVLLAHVGPRRADAPLCRHLNGDNIDNRAENLAWGTHSENLRDAVKHGTAHTVKPIVGQPPRARKLTEEQVLEIVRRASNGESERSIAPDYGISSAHVGQLKRGKSWRYLWQQVA